MSQNTLRPLFTKRRCFSVMVALAFLYAAVTAYFWWTQAEKILAPLEDIPTDPGRMDMPFEPVRVPIYVAGKKTEDQLYAYWVPSDDPDAPVFLYLHGQDATRGKNLEHTERLHQWGWNVLVIDYRGFGERYVDEKPSETKMYEDALSGLAYLEDERGFLPSKIFVYGHSLGGAVAIDIASRPEGADVAGFLIESTFTSVLDMTAHRYNGWLQVLPLNLLLNQRFDSLSKITSVKRPILFVHGTADEKVPYDMTVKLHALAPEPKVLCPIENAGHANCGSIGKRQYRESLQAFVGQCLSNPAAKTP